jgi:hypothetical protein
MIISTYTIWLGCSSALVVFLAYLTPSMIPDSELEGPLSTAFIISSPSQRPAFILSLTCMIFHLAIGILSNWSSKETPKSKSKVLSRGLAAGIAIFAAVLLGQINPVIGGIASTFPAIFGTAMISVWITSGTAVSLGAVESLLLGSWSVSFYAMMTAFFLPWMDSVLPKGLSVTLALIIIYLVSIGISTYPLHVFIQWRLSVNGKSEGGQELTTTL